MVIVFLCHSASSYFKYNKETSYYLVFIVFNIDINYSERRFISHNLSLISYFSEGRVDEGGCFFLMLNLGGS